MADPKEYSLSISIPDWAFLRQTVLDPGTKVCVAFGVGLGNDPIYYYNVVALTESIRPKIDISWTEEHSITATISPCKHMERIQVQTPEVPIKLGQIYTLSPDGENGNITDNTGPTCRKYFVLHVPKSSASSASAILYKSVNGSQTPVLMSGTVPTLQGTYGIIAPKLSCLVWLQAGIEPGTYLHVYRDDIDAISAVEVDFEKVSKRSMALVNESGKAV